MGLEGGEGFDESLCQKIAQIGEKFGMLFQIDGRYGQGVCRLHRWTSISETCLPRNMFLDNVLPIFSLI